MSKNKLWARSLSSASALGHVSRLGVIGSGQMGVGIALVAANLAKLPVTLVDAQPEALKKGLKFMGESLLSLFTSRSMQLNLTIPCEL